MATGADPFSIDFIHDISLTHNRVAVSRLSLQYAIRIHELRYLQNLVRWICNPPHEHSLSHTHKQLALCGRFSGTWLVASKQIENKTCCEQGNREQEQSREKRQRQTERHGDQKGKVGKQEERKKTEGMERNKREGGWKAKRQKRTRRDTHNQTV